MKESKCSHQLNDDQIDQILVSHKINRTKIKRLILKTMSQSHAPLSAQEIFECIGSENCDISTVFRTLTQFKELEIINEVNLAEGFQRFEINMNEHHHHHIRCTECGKIEAITDCDLAHFTKSLIQKGYSEINHHLEFTGICSDCR